MIVSVAQVALLVREYDEAIAFYRDVLGFVLVEDTPLPVGKRWVRLRAPGGGGAEILVSRAVDDAQRASVGRQAGGRVLFFLHTDDFDGDVLRLRKHDVRIDEGPWDHDYGQVVVFRDLYGNRIDLIAPKAIPSAKGIGAGTATPSPQ